MNRTLGRRHFILANNTAAHRDMDKWILDESHVETQTRTDIDDRTRDYLDFTNGISGDDLARINAFEPADLNLKPIGEQRGILSGIRQDLGARRRARATRRAAA